MCRRQEEGSIMIMIFGTEGDLNGVWDAITKIEAPICENNTNYDVWEISL